MMALKRHRGGKKYKAHLRRKPVGVRATERGAVTAINIAADDPLMPHLIDAMVVVLNRRGHGRDEVHRYFEGFASNENVPLWVLAIHFAVPLDALLLEVADEMTLRSGVALQTGATTLSILTRYRLRRCAACSTARAATARHGDGPHRPEATHPRGNSLRHAGATHPEQIS